MKVNDLYLNGFKEAEKYLKAVKVSVESTKDGDIEAIHVIYKPLEKPLELAQIPKK